MTEHLPDSKMSLSEPDFFFLRLRYFTFAFSSKPTSELFLRRLEGSRYIKKLSVTQNINIYK